MAEATPSDTGEPLVPKYGTDGNLEIRGGVGGIRFQFEELLAGASELDALGEAVSAVEREANLVWEQLCPYQNDAPFTGTAALIAVGEARQAARAVREELQLISAKVRASYREYEAAESPSRFGINIPPSGLMFIPQLLADLSLTQFPDRDAVEALITPLSLALMMDIAPRELALSLSADIVAGRDVSAHGPMIRRLMETLAWLKPRPVEAIEGITENVAVDTSPAGLLAMVRRLEERDDGQIDVVRVEDGGRRTFIVVIPGTQPEQPAGGTNPFDEAGIAEGLGYGSEYISAAIRDALRQAGAEAHDQVVAVGYSQGGVHAMNLSRNKAFLAEFDLKYVMTAGSPVGAITPEPGISTLHLEHLQDWVPGADGAPSPDTKDRVTVTLTNRVQTAAGEDRGLGPGHQLSGYEEGARAINSSADPSLLASKAALSAALGAGGAGTVTRFALSRTPREPAVHRPGTDRRPPGRDVRPTGGR